MRRDFKVPRMEEVLEHDRKLLFALKQSKGFVPNVYAFMTRSETALKRLWILWMFLRYLTEFRRKRFIW